MEKQLKNNLTLDYTQQHSEFSRLTVLKYMLGILFLIAFPFYSYADTITVNPVHDGVFYVNGIGLVSWSTIRAASGAGSIVDSATATYGLYYDAGSSAYGTLMRSGFVFDLSTLPVGATVTAATFKIHGDTKTDSISCGDQCSLALVQFTPGSFSSLGNSDYNSSHYGSTRIASDLTYSGWSTGGFNTFTLNSSGFSAIESAAGGDFGLGTLYTADIDNNPPPTVNASSNYIGFWYTNGTYAPELQITYTVGGGGGSGTTTLGFTGTTTLPTDNVKMHFDTFKSFSFVLFTAMASYFTMFVIKLFV